jgi:hypothetical protein
MHALDAPLVADALDDDALDDDALDDDAFDDDALDDDALVALLDECSMAVIGDRRPRSTVVIDCPPTTTTGF